MKNNQKGFTIFLLIVVVVLVAIGGYFVWSINTSNWKTYTNAEYGFEIKIPQDWAVKTEGGGLQFYSQVSRIKNLIKVVKCKFQSNSGIIPCLFLVTDMHFYSANYSYTDTKQEIINGVEWRAIGGTYEGLEYETKQGENLYNFSVVGFPENKEKLAKILSTFKFSDCNSAGEIPPVIDSLSNYSVSVGDTVKIHGCNLSGFEGNKNVWVENKEGVKGFLYGVRDMDFENTQVTLTSPICQKDTSYSNLPCDKTLTLIPGVYKIFVSPWGKESNKVDFIIK